MLYASAEAVERELRKHTMSTTLDVGAIQDRVRRTYGEVAQSATGKFQYATGRQGALALGYDAATIAALGDAVLDVFCGVGNPFALGPIYPGWTRRSSRAQR